MKVLIIAALAFVAVAQAHRDLSQFKPKDIYVTPQRPAPFLPKIVGGKEADVHQFPHQAALFIDGRSFCGGSIIKDNVILTAAHCVDGAGSVEVVIGAHEVQKPETPQQRIVSTTFIIHETWDPNNISDDIALIILPENIELNESAKIISLRSGDCAESSLDQRQATVSGWGRPSDSSGSISPVLRFVSNDLLTNQECKTYFNIIKDTHICLNGSGGRGSCNGDSGGPLIVDNDGSIEEVGIVSFGSGWGCEWGFPTAYTRVTCYTSWIQSKLP